MAPKFRQEVALTNTAYTNPTGAPGVLPGYAFIGTSYLSDCSFYLECTAANTHGSDYLTVGLTLSSGGSDYSGSTIQIPANTSNFTRFRSSSISGIPTNGVFGATIRDNGSAAWDTDGHIADIKIIMVQSSSKIIYTTSFPALGTTLTTAQETLTNSNPKYFYYDSDYYTPAPTVECYFTYSGDSYKDGIQIDLEYSKDMDNWTQLATVTKYSTSDGSVHHSSFGSTLSMVDKAWYRIRYLTEDDKDPVTLYNCYLFIRQSDVSNGITEFITSMEMISDSISTTGNKDYFARYDPAEWDEGGGYCHFVHVMDCSSGSTETRMVAEYGSDTELDGSELRAVEAGGQEQQIIGCFSSAISNYAPGADYDLYADATREALSAEFAADGGKIIGALIACYSNSVPTEIDLQLHGSGAVPGSELDDSVIPVANLETTSLAWHLFLLDSGYDSTAASEYWLAVMHNAGTSSTYLAVGYSTTGDSTYAIMYSGNAKSSWSTQGSNYPAILPVEATDMPGTAQDIYPDVRQLSGYSIHSSKFYIIYKYETGATTLTVNDAYHDNVVTPATASFKLVVTPTVNDAYNVLEDEAPLALGVHLSLNDAYNVLEDDGPFSISQATGLTVADAYHDLVDDGPLDLTVHLSVNDAYHDNVVDPATASFLLVVTPTVADCEHTLIDEGPLTLTIGGIHNLVMDADNYHLHDADAADYVSVTLFDPTVATGDSTWSNVNGTGWIYRNARQKMKSTHLARSGRYIRIQIGVAGAYGIDINGMSVGRILANDSPDFRETPTRITFNSGSNTLDLSNGQGPEWSDWIEVNLDANEDYLIHATTYGNQSIQGLSFVGVASLEYSGWTGGGTSTDITMVADPGIWPFGYESSFRDYRKGENGNFGAQYWGLITKVEIRGEIVLDEVSPHDLLVDDAHHHMTSDTFTLDGHYLWDFRGYTIGVQPSDWTEVYYTSAYYDYDVIENLTDSIGGRYLRMNTATIYGERGIGPDDVPMWRSFYGSNIGGWHFDDFDLLCRWQTNLTNSGAFNIFFRGEWRSTYNYTGYQLEALTSTDQIKLHRVYRDSIQSGTNTVAKTLDASTWYWTRIRANGTSIKIKVWANTIEEPAAWDIDITESDWNFEYGLVTPYVAWANASIYVDYWEISSGGTLLDQAPVATHVGEHALEDDGPITIEEKIWLTIQDAEHTLEDDGPLTITQKIVLAVADAYHDLVDEGPLALTVHLSVNDCYHENVVTPTNLTLTEAVGLTVNDAYHDLIDEGPLDLTPVITVADSYHDLVDTGPLAIGVHLVVNDCENANVVTPTNITLTPVITVADCTHDLVDTGPLALTVHLDVNDAYSVLEDDGPITLETTGIVNLVLQDAEHTVSDPGPLALTVHLVLADATHDLVDEGPLALGVHLVVNDCENALVDTGPFLLTPIITVADAFHDLVDEGPLALTPVITVADCYHVLEDEGPITLTLGAIDLVVADCEHTLICDGPITITQKHILVVADCEHTVTCDGPITISVGTIDLVVADCFHLHDAESPYLVVALVVADCYHIHAPPELALTQTHILSLNDAFHDHIAESPTLELTITVSDCYHEHTADTINLTVILTIEDCYHLHDAESLALTQTHILTVASCEDALTSDNVAMIVPLTVNGLTHEVTSDNILLLQDHLLAVGGIYHVHVVDSPTLSQLHILSDLDTYILHYADNVTIPTLEGDLDHLSVVSITTVRSFGKVSSKRTIVRVES